MRDFVAPASKMVAGATRTVTVASTKVKPKASRSKDGERPSVRAPDPPSPPPQPERPAAADIRGKDPISDPKNDQWHKTRKEQGLAPKRAAKPKAQVAPVAVTREREEMVATISELRDELKAMKESIE